MTIRDIAELVLQVDARQIRDADNSLQHLENQGGRTERTLNFLTTAAKLAAAAFAAIKLAKLVEETTMLAARFETMGVVMRVAGNNAGYTNAQMLGMEQQLQKTGISMIKSREALTSLATANIDLSKAAGLARASQDLAVVGNINSSEAYGRLVQGIKSGEVEVLRTLGLNVSFENSYKRLASQLGTTAEKLTEGQKVQARTNEVLRQAATYSGIYEEAMGTAGKQVNSLARYVEDAKVKIGALFLPAFSDMVVKYTDALKAANAELDRLGQTGATADIGKGIATGLRVAFEAVVVLGANTLFVVKTIGKELGAGAAGLATLFMGPINALNKMAEALDLIIAGKFGEAQKALAGAGTALSDAFKGAAAIAADVAAETAADRVAVDAFTDSILGTNRAIAAGAAISQADADAKEQQRIAAGKAARKAQEDEAKRLAAADEARKQQKKYDETYKSTIKDIYERTAALQLDMATEGKLTEGQKFAVKVLDDLRTGELKLANVKKTKLAAMLEEYLRQERLNAARDADAKALQAQQDALNLTVSAIWENVRAVQAEIENYGRLPDEVTKASIAKLQASLSAVELTEAEIAAIEGQILALQKLGSAQLKLQNKGAEFKRLQDLKDEAKRTADSIGNSITDALMRGFESGKSFAQGLRDTVVNMFKTLVLRPIVQAIVQPMATGITQALGIGSAASSGIGLASTLSGIKSAYSAITAGFAGISTAVADGVQAAMYATGMTDSLLVNGAFANGVGAAAGIGAGALGGILGGKLISGQYGSNATVNVGTAAGAAIGSIVPVLGTALGALVGGLLGGLGNRLFGMGSTEVQSQGVRGTLGASGFTGETFQNLHQDGGWFRSDKNWSATQAASPDMSKAFSDAYAGIKDASATFAVALGVNADSVKTRTQELNIALTNDADTNTKAVTAFFADVANAIAVELVPGLAQFSAANESLSATLQRLATEYAAVDGIMSSLGLTMQQVFGATGVAALAGQEQLLKAAGGVDKLAASTGYFAQNFLTAEQQLAPVQKALTQGLTDLGYSYVTNGDQFREVVLSLASSGQLASAAGAQTYTALLALAPAMKAVTDAADAAAKVEQQRAAAIAQERAGLQDQLDQLTMSSTQLLTKQRDALDASNRALFDQVQAVTAAKTAQEAAAEASRAAAESAKAQQEALRGMIGGALQEAQGAIQKAYDAQAGALQTVIDASKKAAASTREYAASLATSALSPLNESARLAQMKRELATAPPDQVQAKANAYLQLLQSQGSALEYARGFAQTQGVLEGLATSYESTATVAQQQLDALNAMVGGLAKVNTTIGTVADAIANYQNMIVFWRGVQMDGSHAGGLGSVPFDGYRAVLHRKEAVLTAPQAKAYREGDAAAAEVSSLRTEMRVLLGRISSSTATTADLTERVTNGGTAMITEAS